MSADDESDWSDSSAGSVASSFSTSVMLGLPDGAIESATDLADACVSRLGGPPAFLSSLPAFPDPATATACPTCARPAELLLQLYAPLEGSVDDRVVYVFGCARAGCQGEAGGSKKGRCVRASSCVQAPSPPSPLCTHPFPLLCDALCPNPLARADSLRAFSSIVRNDRFASAHERRAAKKAAKAEAAAAAASPSQASGTPAAGFNPFAATAAAAPSSAPFNPFAAPTAPAAASANPFAAPSNPFAPAAPATAAAAPAATAVDDLAKQTGELALGKEPAADDDDESDDDETEDGPRPTPDPGPSSPA
jgi:hypothetical protein